MKDHTGRAGGEEKEEERRKSGCERRAAVTIEVKNDSFGGGVVGWGEVLQKARWKAVPQGLAEAGGGERQGILKIIRIVSAFHLLTHNLKKGLHNRLVNTTFLLQWFPKGLTASLLRDYFQEPGSGHLLCNLLAPFSVPLSPCLCLLSACLSVSHTHIPRECWKSPGLIWDTPSP